MKKSHDAILLLGLKLQDDGSPREELLLRIRKAAQCYHQGLAPLVIPCGGQRPGTPVTEAAVMKKELMDLSVPESAIRCEDRSQITVENMRNARKMLDREKPRVIVVTSDYHALRALLICRHTAGMRASRRSARIPWHIKRKAALMEPLYLIDYLLGYQASDKPRPKLYLKIMYALGIENPNKKTGR